VVIVDSRKNCDAVIVIPVEKVRNKFWGFELDATNLGRLEDVVLVCLLTLLATPAASFALLTTGLPSKSHGLLTVEKQSLCM
jgi:hypothetical protein